MRTLFIFLILMLPCGSFAQTDTIFTWLDRDDKATDKHSAVYIRKQYVVSSGCKVQEFHLVTGALTLDASYDFNCKKKHGELTWYSDSGRLKEKSVYANDVKKEHHIYHPNGNKKMEAYFNENKLTTIKGWDVEGNEIPKSIYQQEASFPGGMKAWQRYLSRAIASDLPAVYKKGFITGSAIVDFSIDTNGLVAQARVSISSGFPDLDEHALNIIKNSPKWHPAIQYNIKVIFRQRQTFTYPIFEQ